MSYSTLSNSCKSNSIAILSNNKFITPDSKLYSLYPINNCKQSIKPTCCCGQNTSTNSTSNTSSCNCVDEINRYTCCQNSLCENKSCC